MANRQVYQLTNKTPITSDVLPIQDAAGSQEAKKTTVQSILNLVPTVNTGSLVSTSSFNSWTGSTTSQFAGTASYIQIAETASYVLNAESSSYASTASYVTVFPYTGSAEISGSLNVIGTATLTSESIMGDIISNIGDTFTGTDSVTKIVSLNQAEYDALSPNYDANTLYVVI